MHCNLYGNELGTEPTSLGRSKVAQRVLGHFDDPLIYLFGPTCFDRADRMICPTSGIADAARVGVRDIVVSRVFLAVGSLMTRTVLGLDQSVERASVLETKLYASHFTRGLID